MPCTASHPGPRLPLMNIAASLATVMPQVSAGTPLLVPAPHGGSPVGPSPEPSARLLEVSCWALGCLGVSLHTLSLPDSIQSRASNITNALKRPTCDPSEPHTLGPNTHHPVRLRGAHFCPCYSCRL